MRSWEIITVFCSTSYLCSHYLQTSKDPLQGSHCCSLILNSERLLQMLEHLIMRLDGRFICQELAHGRCLHTDSSFQTFYFDYRRTLEPFCEGHLLQTFMVVNKRSLCESSELLFLSALVFFSSWWFRSYHYFFFTRHKRARSHYTERKAIS